MRLIEIEPGRFINPDHVTEVIRGDKNVDGTETIYLHVVAVSHVISWEGVFEDLMYLILQAHTTPWSYVKDPR